MLLTISLVYLFTWLPLGIFGALADANVEVFINNPDTTTIIFMLCHLIGMSSSCANPIIYGFRNKHLRNGKLIFLLFSSNLKNKLWCQIDWIFIKCINFSFRICKIISQHIQTNTQSISRIIVWFVDGCCSTTSKFW